MRRGLLVPQITEKPTEVLRSFPQSLTAPGGSRAGIPTSALWAGQILVRSARLLLPSPIALKRSLVRLILLTLFSLTQPCGDGNPSL